MKKAETKYYTLGGDDTLLYHDRGTTTATAVGGTQGALIWDPWVNIGQGTGVRNRVGDEIYPRGMALSSTPNFSTIIAFTLDAISDIILIFRFLIILCKEKDIITNYKNFIF